MVRQASPVRAPFLIRLDLPIPGTPAGRRALAARLRALSAARLAVALVLGSGAHPIATDAREARAQVARERSRAGSFAPPSVTAGEVEAA